MILLAKSFLNKWKAYKKKNNTIEWLKQFIGKYWQLLNIFIYIEELLVFQGSMSCKKNSWCWWCIFVSRHNFGITPLSSYLSCKKFIILHSEFRITINAPFCHEISETKKKQMSAFKKTILEKVIFTKNNIVKSTSFLSLKRIRCPILSVWDLFEWQLSFFQILLTLSRHLINH